MVSSIWRPIGKQTERRLFQSKGHGLRSAKQKEEMFVEHKMGLWEMVVGARCMKGNEESYDALNHKKMFLLPGCSVGEDMNGCMNKVSITRAERAAAVKVGILNGGSKEGSVMQSPSGKGCSWFA